MLKTQNKIKRGKNIIIKKHQISKKNGKFKISKI
jgi:hypothetical protein